MKRLFTLILFFSFISDGISDPKKPKPKGCTVYSCTDWVWKQGKSFFDPHTIKWPLHYNGKTYKDKIDGGEHDIHVVFGHYGVHHKLPLGHYRNSSYYKDPWFLDEGITMPDPFECKAYVNDKPTWKNNKCAMVQAGYEDTHVYFDGPGCSKIIRQWTVIDWCKYEPNTIANTKPEKYALVKDLTTHEIYWSYGKDPHDIQHDGWYSFQQVIKILDKDPPELKYTDDQEYDLNGDCHAKIWLENKVIDHGECPGYNTAVEIKVYDGDHDHVLSDWVTAKNNKEFKINLGYLSAGWYKVHYHLKDGCGNVSDYVQKLKIVDKNPPHLICIKDLSTSISDDYGVSIWAKDYVHKVTGPCYDNNLTYSFSKDSHQPSLHFDCTNDGVGLHDMEVYVTASNGVWTSCNVTLMVADHSHCSDTTRQIAGKILNRYGYEIEGANAVAYVDDEMLVSEASNRKGTYDLKGIPYDYKAGKVTAKYDDKSKNGLDAIDLIYLLRYVQGIDEFRRVEQKAAADFNSDGVVDLEDYLDLTYLIYDVPGRELKYEPWKFYEEKMRFSGISNHMTFFGPVKMHRFKYQYNFIGIKNGDLNYSWSPYKSLTSRSATKSEFTFTNTSGISTYSISIPDEGMIQSLFIESQDPAVINITSNGIPLQFVEGVIDGKEGIIVLSEENLSGTLISIEANVNTTKPIAGVLFDTEIMGEERMISWHLEEVPQRIIADISARPNPFIEQVELVWYSEDEKEVTLDIFDAAGRRIHSTYWTLSRGTNQKVLDGTLFRKGLHIISVYDGNSIITKRIIKN